MWSCSLLFLHLPTQINISNFDLVMESDLGTFTPLGLQFTGNDAARKVGLKTQCRHTIISLYSGLKDTAKWQKLVSIYSLLHIRPKLDIFN